MSKSEKFRYVDHNQPSQTISSALARRATGPPWNASSSWPRPQSRIISSNPPLHAGARTHCRPATAVPVLSSKPAVAPGVPDWARPGSATHTQVPPPMDFHRPSANFDAPIGILGPVRYRLGAGPRRRQLRSRHPAVHDPLGWLQHLVSARRVPLPLEEDVRRHLSGGGDGVRGKDAAQGPAAVGEGCRIRGTDPRRTGGRSRWLLAQRASCHQDGDCNGLHRLAFPARFDFSLPLIYECRRYRSCRIGRSEPGVSGTTGRRSSCA